MCHDLCHSVTVIAIRRVNHVYDFLKIRMLLNIVFNFSLLEEKIKKKFSFLSLYFITEVHALETLLFILCMQHNHSVLYLHSHYNLVCVSFVWI